MRSAVHGAVAALLLLAPAASADPAGKSTTDETIRAASGTVAPGEAVFLLGANGSPVTAPSVPDGPGGSPVALRPGQAATFAYGEPNVCDRTVSGSRIRVTLPGGQGSLTVGLGAEARYGTCAPVRVQAMERATG